MKIIVHIGSEKTGTTSIQSFLNQNRGELLKQGVYFPTSIGDLNHVKLVAYCERGDFGKRIYSLIGVHSQEEKDQWSSKLLEEFKQEIQSLPEHVHTVVISSELFHSNLSEPGEVQTLKELLDAMFDEISILVYLRRQIDTAISVYSTHLRAGGTNEKPIPERVNIKGNYYNYKTLLDLWKSTFDPSTIDVRIFDKKKLVDGNVVSDFSEKIGVLQSLDKLVLPESLNSSLSVLGQYLLREANYIMPFSPQQRGKRKKLIEYLESKYSGVPMRPPADVCMQFQSKFEGDNSLVAQEWLGVDQLFDEYVPKSPNENQSLPPEGEVNIAMEELKLFIDVI